MGIKKRSKGASVPVSYRGNWQIRLNDGPEDLLSPKLAILVSPAGLPLIDIRAMPGPDVSNSDRPAAAAVARAPVSSMR